MTPKLCRAAVVSVTLAAAFVATTLAGSAQTTDPTVTIDRTGTAAGETMLVTGAGWTDGATLIVELCGHGGLRGTVDCDVPDQRTAGVSAGGTFSVQLTTALPPSPCPCVVKATDQASQVAATSPIAVAGLPTVPLTADDIPPARSLEITSLKISGGGQWSELFGAGGRRVLAITLTNTGPLAIDSPHVNVAWGQGARPDGFVAPPETKRMEPGAAQTLTVALHRAAFTIGEQTAVVEVQGIGTRVVGRARTTAYPWGLLAIGLLVLQLLLLRLRNRVRRRVRRGQEPLPEPPALGQATLELPAGPAVSDVGPATEGHDVPTLIDLDAFEREDARSVDSAHEAFAAPDGDQASRNGASANGASGNGVSGNGASGNGSTGPVSGWVAGVAPASALGAAAVPMAPEHDAGSPGLADAAAAELVALRREAQRALDRASELSDALVAASAARVNALEAQTAEHLALAEGRHSQSIELLASARARADELLAASSDAAAEMLRDARSSREAAHLVLGELDTQRTELFDAASEAVDEVLRELDDHVQALLATDAATALDAPPASIALGAGPRAPRLGGLEDRLASAISKAFASVSSDDSTTD